MGKTTLDLAGVLPPLTTPFDDRGNLDLEALAGNVERYASAGLAGFLALGSNGEAAHLTAAERAQVIAAVRQAAAPDLAVVAGVNELSTRAAIAATQQAADAGADAALVITPYFFKSSMSQYVLRRFFEEVAQASPLPVLIYNVPQNTGVVVAPETIAALAGHGNIVGVKDSAGDLAAIADTVDRAPAGFQVLVGNADIFYPALAMGVTGAILAVACLAPEPCVEIHRAAAAGEHQRALGFQRRLTPLARLVTSGLGVPGLKAALDLAGFAGGPPRGPLQPIGDEGRRRLALAMERSGFFE